MLSTLAPARRRLFVAVGALVLLGTTASVVTVILHRPPAADPVTQDAQPPVLLVPGYGGSRTGLEHLATGLRAAGRLVQVVDLGGNDLGDLRQQAAHLDAAARAEMKRTGSTSIDLVGYSAGGVVVRLWVRDHSGGSVARRVVTLGSPQHGTDIAGLASDVAPDACPTACQQLAPDSSVLAVLNAGDETPAGPRWVSIWTERDQTVVPASSAVLAGALNFSVQSICPSSAVSHGGLPSDPTVIAMTVRALGRAIPTRPTAGICASP